MNDNQRIEAALWLLDCLDTIDRYEIKKTDAQIQGEKYELQAAISYVSFFILSVLLVVILNR